ncbi:MULTISPECIES: DUF6542 domain-containing protein [unclassified Kitasatospora]|uniref:DUF6542 domain-containing protein n=1 Tax=unclassified Kitasatospora TaxID=2633591 RepID=UPI0024741F47|nr:DUF6542 domain-containing protein [Kitasatospora sp. MAP12-44]
MEQSIRTQPPGPRPRPPVGGGAAEAAVPAPAAPRDAGPRPSRLRTASGAAGPARLKWKLPLSRPAERQRSGRPARLTAIGTGVLTLAGTLAAAALDQLMFGGLGVLFGLGFLAVCFQAAVRVRSADLAAAPISGPIAFALALLLLGPVSSPGVIGQVLALATGLALRAGWLFAGTGLAAAIVTARFVAQRRIRRQQHR